MKTCKSLYVLTLIPLLCMVASAETKYISDMQFTVVKNGWGPAERDMSNGEQLARDGKTMTIGTTTYTKGLGVHAASEIRVPLNGTCTSFISDIGIDAEVGKAGQVSFQVFADGAQLFASRHISGGTGPQRVSVSVTGKKQLVLIVTDGANGTNNDHADWGAARLDCTGTTPPPTPTPTPIPTPTSNVGPVAVTQPSGAKVVNPGDDLASLVSNSPTGTSFFLKSGVYRMQSVQVKDGDTFLGELGATMSGARVLTSFSREGSYYVAAGQTQHGDSVPGSLNCLSSAPRCSYPEDLFFDNMPLFHVAKLSDVSAGKWFFDYSAQKIYFADDPTGHTVETSVTPFAFYGQADNVTIQNLTIEKYATPAQNGAILCAVIQNRAPQGHNWIVKNNTIRLNHGGGIFASDRMQILNNNVYRNGQMGLLGDGDAVLVQGNEIAYNNYAGYEPGWEAGGTKFVGTTNIIIRGNYSHDNKGTGLWLDYKNSSALIENNHTSHNQLYGIQQEIGGSVIIRNNVVENEGSNPTAPSTAMWYSGGIVVSASGPAEVYGNTVTNCVNGIGAIHGDRGADFLVKGLNVHDNTIVQNGGTAAGIIKTGSDDSIFSSWNNHFQHNTYTLTNGANYNWMNGDKTKSEWVAYGNDTTGVWK